MSGKASAAAWVTVCFQFRRDSRVPHIMGNVGNVRFVLFLSVGAAWGAKIQCIENRKGGGALAFHGRHFNNKYNNQPKGGILGGDNIWEGARPQCKVWEGRYPIDWGGKSGDKIIEEKIIRRGLQGRPMTRNTQQPTKNLRA